MQRLRRACGVFLLGGLVAFVGCDGNKTGEVRGTVKVDGNLPEKGQITFFPVDGTSPTAGGEIKNGKYSVRVPVGTMKVTISVPVLDYKKKLYDRENSPVGEMYKESLPARFNEQSELMLEVHSGSNEKDWELSSK